MPHTYTARALPTACNIYRDGEPFALLTPRNMSKDDYLAVMRFTEALPQVIEALRECERRLSYLVERDGHKLLDVVARDKARAALQSIGIA